MTPKSQSSWEKIVASQFDSLSARLPNQIESDDPRVQAVYRSVSNWDQLKVLDIGCGSGRYWPLLRAWGAEVSGLDLSYQSLLKADETKIRVQGSTSHLPWANEHFDVVLLIETLQHHKTPEITLHEALRVLRPGGRIVIVDRNPLGLNDKRAWMPSLILKSIDQRRALDVSQGFARF